jgi:branched-chain amino acid transport system permease protein
MLVAGSVALLFGLNFLIESFLGPYHIRIIVLSCIYITMAVSLNLINGYTGQFSIGHAGFMAIGAYTAGALSYYFGNLSQPGHDAGMQFLLRTLHLPEPVAAVLFFAAVAYIGGVAASLAGLIVGIPTLRLKGDYLAIATLGFGEIIRVVILNMEFLGGARGLTDIPGTGAPHSLFENPFIWVAATAAVTIVVSRNMVESTRGRAFLAVRDDEVAAESVGISTTRYKVTAFVVSAFFAGVAGAMAAHFDSYLTTENFNFLKSIEVVVMVVLGGMGSLTGVTAAAVILTVLPEFLRASGQLRMVVYSLLLIALMILRPQGLLGHRTLKGRRKARAAEAAGS